MKLEERKRTNRGERIDNEYIRERLQPQNLCTCFRTKNHRFLALLLLVDVSLIFGVYVITIT